MRELTETEKAILDQHTKWLGSDGRAGTCADLRRADLRGANLREADLSEADLSGANLCGADLCGADLCGANLCGANLCEADLREADLRWSGLCGANLREADLREADLRRADLRGANLREADLRGADLDFSSWPLWCGSSNVKAGDRLVAQLLWHVTRLDVSGCSGGVQEAIEHIRSMGIADLFCEYRDDIS